MTVNEKEYAKVIAKNLKRIMFEHDKTQADICKDLGLKQSTVSSWVTGTRAPRMSKIDMLCEYFNCKRSDIMEDHYNVLDIDVPDVIKEALSGKQRDRLLQYAQVLIELEKLEGFGNDN